MDTKKATYNLSPWSLKDLFPGMDSPELTAGFEKLEKLVADFDQVRPLLKDDITTGEFMDILHKLEEITLLSNAIYSFANLAFYEDTQNQKAQTLSAKVDQFIAEMQNKLLFFSLWWKMVDDAVASRLLPATGDFRYWLEQMRLLKKYTLSEAEEKVINYKNVTGARALNTLYDSITNRYVFKMQDDGQVKELTRGGLAPYIHSNNPDHRANAYQELYRVYGQDGGILGQMYQTLARDYRNENITIRGYKTPISVRNTNNDLPDEVVDLLLESCKKNTGIYERFFKMKARLLGMDRLRRYDIYAPVVKSDKVYPFDQATRMVFDSYRTFDPSFEEMARRVYETQHLDSEVRKGKQDGAFCWTASPKITPWVKVNYHGEVSDVTTLAHELGHAIHSMLSCDHTAFTNDSCLPLAETASTFGEMLLVDKMLKEESDANVRRDILFKQLDEAYGTVQRQAFFAIYEKTAHEMAVNGASVDEMAEAYLENLRTQFKDAVEVTDEFKWEWVSIPHIYLYPFYVYAYAFGQLLVLSLYEQYKQEGESFKARYIRLLSRGGSMKPIEILDEAGVDVRKEAFWQGGFNVLDGLVKQLESEC